MHGDHLRTSTNRTRATLVGGEFSYHCAMVSRENKNNAYSKFGVGSYLLLNTIFHWLYSDVLPIVFCAKFIVIFVLSVVLLANPEAR